MGSRKVVGLDLGLLQGAAGLIQLGRHAAIAGDVALGGFKLLHPRACRAQGLIRGRGLLAGGAQGPRQLVDRVEDQLELELLFHGRGRSVLGRRMHGVPPSDGEFAPGHQFGEGEADHRRRRPVEDCGDVGEGVFDP
ncbi:hypothetical protein D3C86_1402850 [compost metagenome]